MRKEGLKDLTLIEYTECSKQGNILNDVVRLDDRIG